MFKKEKKFKWATIGSSLGFEIIGVFESKLIVVQNQCLNLLTFQAEDCPKILTLFELCKSFDRTYSDLKKKKNHLHFCSEFKN